MAFVDSIGLDLQILICTHLHPSDILTLRKTCKTLQFVTRKRTIWVDALRRVCLANTLFLPSFPILDMSDVELEQAAIAPRRWIELSTARGPSSQVTISPTTSRIIDDPLPGKRVHNVILVPGGRYMVCFTLDGLGVWDLGYSPSADCKLIASVEPEGGSSVATGNVHATPDGMGLVIFSHRRGIEDYSFYEIYPQSESPQLTKIACLEILPPRYDLRSYISPEKVIWFNPHDILEVTLAVWDYRLNASVSFRALVDVDTVRGNAKVVATQTAIVLLKEEAVYIWAIPPLKPGPPDFDEYPLNRSPPLIRVKYPDGLSLSPHPATWRTMSSWYFDPSKPLYFDKVTTRCSQLQRFKLFIEPDFGDATLHFINTIQLATHSSVWELPFQSKLCEDTLVINWNFSGLGRLYTGSTLPCPTMHPGHQFMTEILLSVDKPRELSICPASGRLVNLYCRHDTDKIVVYDFIPR